MLTFVGKKLANSSKHGIMKFILVCLTVCGSAYAFSFLLMQWSLGCNSISTVGYFTLSECKHPALSSEWSTRANIQFLVAASIQSWMTLDAVGSSSIVAAIVLVQAYCQWRYLKMVACLMLDKLGCSRNDLLLLRRLQLLNRYYNLVQQGYILPAIIFMGISATVLGFYVLISLGTHISKPELLLCITLASVGLGFVMVITTGMSWIYAESGKKVQFAMKAFLFPNIGITKERKWAQKYARSFPPLKCYL